MATVDIDLNLEVKNATKAIKSFASSTQKQIKSISSDFKALKSTAVVAVGVFVTGKLVGAIKDITDAAAIQEDAIKKMNTALALTGDFSEEASQEMQQFASDMQAVTTTGDEVILSQIALAKSFGATNEQAQDIIKAALDLSAATGQDLESAVRNVSKTLGGFAGELGESIPQLKALTKEQLQAGAGIELLGNRFRGASQEIAKTFSGSVQQSKNLVGDLVEELGFLITKNDFVINAVGLFSNALKNSIKVISDNRDNLIGFVNKGFRALIKVIPPILKGFRYLIQAFEGLALISSTLKLSISELALALLEFSAVRTYINFVADVFRGLAGTVLKVVSSIIDGLSLIPGASSVLSSMGFDVDSVSTKLDGLGSSLYENIGEPVTDDISQGFKDMRDNALESSGSISGAFAEVYKGMDFVIETSEDLTKSILESGDAQVTASNKAIQALSDQAKAQKDLADSAFTGPQATPEQLKAGQEQFKEIEATNKKIQDEEKKSAEALGKVLTDAASAITSGAEGAKNAFVQAATLGATAVFGPGGAAIGPLIGLFAQGPEQTRAMIEEFANAVPDIVVAIAESAPVFVEALAENIDKIIIPLLDINLWYQVAIKVTEALIFQLVPNLVVALLQAIQNAISQFGGGLKKAGENFSAGVRKAVGFIAGAFRRIADFIEEFFTGLFSGVVAMFEAVFSPLIEFGKKIEQLISKVSELLGGGSAKKALVGEESVFAKGAKALGFASGGEVPAGFPNDTFPARLTSGENVVDTSTNQKLNKFLDGQGSDGAMEAILIQILGALQSGKQVNATIELDGNVLADTILDLNQRNARLA